MTRTRLLALRDGCALLVVFWSIRIVLSLPTSVLANRLAPTVCTIQDRPEVTKNVGLIK